MKERLTAELKIIDNPKKFKEYYSSHIKELQNLDNPKAKYNAYMGRSKKTAQLKIVRFLLKEIDFE